MMARWSGAAWLPIPENATQSRISPNKLIFHSVSAPWSVGRIREFWKESGVVTESHFGIAYDGSAGQFLDSSVRADANVSANGTAISCETASKVGASDPWTEKQVNKMVALMVWAHRAHGIPARICRSSTDSGFGIHNMFSSWSGGGTTCPGPARTKQFRAVVFPRFLKALGQGGGQASDPVSTIRVADVQLGDDNGSVREMQKRLIAKGHKIPAGATGYFGPQTQRAVDAYRRKIGLKGSDASGAVGKYTLGKLFPGWKVV